MCNTHLTSVKSYNLTLSNIHVHVHCRHVPADEKHVRAAQEEARPARQEAQVLLSHVLCCTLHAVFIPSSFICIKFVLSFLFVRILGLGTILYLSCWTI